MAAGEKTPFPCCLCCIIVIPRSLPGRGADPWPDSFQSLSRGQRRGLPLSRHGRHLRHLGRDLLGKIWFGVRRRVVLELVVLGDLSCGIECKGDSDGKGGNFVRKISGKAGTKAVWQRDNNSLGKAMGEAGD